MKTRDALIGAVIAAALCGAAGAEEPAVRVAFNISPQPIGRALTDLGEQAGLQVLVRGDDLQGSKALSKPVTGELTVRAALEKVLENSGLTYEFLDDRTVRVRTADASATANGGDRPLAGAQSRPRDQAVASRVPSQAADPGEGADTQSKGSMEEVLVTAQKRSERLQDVPVPVSTVTAESLTQSNQLRLQDFYAQVPGLAVAPSPGAGGQQSISIRGISTGSFTVPTVGVTVDDVPFGSSTNFAGSIIPDFDPSDLERIEVLRGPQGTLYGASSMGGLLKFVTVDPSTTASSGRLEAGTSYVENGSSLGYNLRGAVNVPVSDTFAFRASGFTREVPGYIDNPLTGERAVNGQRVSGGRVSALWKPGDTLSVKLSALYQDDKGDSANEVNVLPGLGDLEQSYIRGTGGYERKTQAYSATVSATLGRVDLVSITGYNVNEFFNSGDSTYSLGTCCTLPVYGVTGSPLLTLGETRKFTQEVRATIPIGEKVELLLGGFYSHEDSPYRQINLAANANTGAVIAQSWDSTYPSTYRELGEFANLTVHFTEGFDIQLGARQAQLDQRFGPCVYQGPLFGDGGCPLTYTEDDASTYLVTPRLRLNDDLMVYARAASGFRAGGPNVFNPNPTVPRHYDPDETRTYEIGVKGSSPSRVVSFDASVFHIDFQDLQINLLDPAFFLVYTSNGSRAKSEGVELSVEIRPREGLSITTWGAYTDAVLTQDMPSNSSVIGNEGNRLPYSARVTGNLSVRQELPLSGSLSGFFGAALTYVGDRMGTFVSTTNRERYPSYTKIDLNAGIRFDAWSASLYANNVGDKRGVLGGGAGTYPPFAFTYIQPRTVGVTITRLF